MKRILLLTTGGTIASRLTEEGLAPGLDGEALARYLGALAGTYELTVRDILHLDSSNIQPEEWRLIAKSVFEAREAYDGVVISPRHGHHGLYPPQCCLTWCPTSPSPWCSPGPSCPSSTLSPTGWTTCAPPFAMAASGCPGVFLAFNRKVMLGCRAVKTRTTDFDAFDSVNWPLVAQVSGSGLTVRRSAIPPLLGPCRLRDQLCERCSSSSSPGAQPGDLRHAPADALTGAWSSRPSGPGGCTSSAATSSKSSTTASQAGMAVVVCSQCLYESSRLHPLPGGAEGPGGRGDPGVWT